MISKDFTEFKIDFSNLKSIFQVIYSAQVTWSNLECLIESRSMIKSVMGRGASWSVDRA